MPVKTLIIFLVYFSVLQHFPKERISESMKAVIWATTRCVYFHNHPLIPSSWIVLLHTSFITCQAPDRGSSTAWPKGLSTPTCSNINMSNLYTSILLLLIVTHVWAWLSMCPPNSVCTRLFSIRISATCSCFFCTVLQRNCIPRLLQKPATSTFTKGRFP